MTNLEWLREWLRSLSAEELVKFLSGSRCRMCVYCSDCTEDNHDCTGGKVMWRKQEHKIELKPCPCCGGKAVVADVGVGVYCDDCGMGTTFGVTEIEDAIKTWNRRVDNG